LCVDEGYPKEIDKKKIEEKKPGVREEYCTVRDVDHVLVAEMGERPTGMDPSP
jgi:hypothetical protein